MDSKLKLARGVSLTIIGIGILYHFNTNAKKYEAKETVSIFPINMVIGILPYVWLDYSNSNSILSVVDKESSSAFLPWMLFKWTYTASFALWNYYNSKVHLNTRSKMQICSLLLPLFLIATGFYYCVSMFKMYLMLRENENRIANEQTDEVSEEASDEESDEENDTDINLYSALMENEPLRYEISYEDNTIWYNEFQIN